MPGFKLEREFTILDCPRTVELVLPRAPTIQKFGHTGFHYAWRFLPIDFANGDVDILVVGLLLGVK